MDLYEYWKATLRQDVDAMRPFFHPDASICWHNTDEQFTVDEYLDVNREYPGSWDGKVERLETVSEWMITVVHVYSGDRTQSFHVTSFFRLRDGKIDWVDEYWGEDGPPPTWRLKKKVGRSIRQTGSERC